MVSSSIPQQTDKAERGETGIGVVGCRAAQTQSFQISEVADDVAILYSYVLHSVQRIHFIQKYLRIPKIVLQVELDR